MGDEMRTPQYGRYQVQQRTEEHTSYAEEFPEKTKKKGRRPGQKRRGGFGRRLAETAALAAVAVRREEATEETVSRAASEI